jgi:hypothetical protein
MFGRSEIPLSRCRPKCSVQLRAQRSSPLPSHLQAMASSSYSLFCMGNPLLDMQVTNGEALLEKYQLKANDAILASSTHTPM